MQWKFGGKHFDSETGVIISGSDKVMLEPKATALLKFFCMHPHRDISRDELIEHVWHGQIVSDNAINRVIAQLRKALRDEKKPRKFIATLPKIGYRFISDPEEQPVAQTNNFLSRVSFWKNSIAFGIIAGLLLIVGIFLLSRSESMGNYFAKTRSIQPLSRKSGWQIDADLSPDGELLLYSMADDRGTAIYLQNTKTDVSVAVTPEEGSAHGGRWSHSGQFFVYAKMSKGDCEFRKITVSNGAATSNELLQKCIPNSGTNFAISLDDKILYFVERRTPFSPFEAFALDMEKQQRWRLAQPPATNFGSHYLDVHPITGKILLVLEPNPGKSALYELDVPGKSYEKLLDFDYDLFSAIWGHKPNTVVHPAEHPSYELIETNLETGKSTILVSDSRRISNPRRINKSKDYIFSSYLNNRDIEVTGYSGSNLNSAVMDYLPELSHSSDKLAFISKRSGDSKLWILDLAKDELTSIETGDFGRTFYNLAWSNDDAHIAANTSKGIVIYDILKSKPAHMLDIQKLAYAVDWFDESHISYSEYVDERWQVYVRNIKTNSIRKLDEDTSFVIAGPKGRVYIDKGYKLTLGKDVTYDTANCTNLIFRFQLNYKLVGEKLYCRERKNRNRLLQIENDRTEQFSDKFNDAEFFSVSKEKLALTKVTSASNDVMRTN